MDRGHDIIGPVFNWRIKTVDGVTVLNLYTKSDGALNLYHVSTKYLKGFHSY